MDELLQVACCCVDMRVLGDCGEVVSIRGNADARDQRSGKVEEEEVEKKMGEDNSLCNTIIENSGIGCNSVIRDVGEHT